MVRLRKFYVKSGDLKCTLTAQSSFWAAAIAVDEHMFDGCKLDKHFIYVNECGFDSIEDAEQTDWWETDGIMENLGYYDDELNEKLGEELDGENCEW